MSNNYVQKIAQARIFLTECFLSIANKGKEASNKEARSETSSAKTKQALSLDDLKPVSSGDKGARTPDLLDAIEALSQLSYIP
jgi:hypothetical protein